MLKIESLPILLSKYEGKKVLCLTGRSFERFILPIIEKYIPIPNKIYFYNNFSPDPDAEDLSRAIEFYKKHDFDLIISIGGGSVIDMGKLINYFGNNSITIDDYINNHASVDLEVKDFIAIPTTFGSGSEATKFAVLYKKNIKHSIEHEKLIPKYTVIDSVFRNTLSNKQAAISAMDAFCQALESTWAVGANEESLLYSLEALKILNLNIIQYVNQPEANINNAVAKASHLAGKAINISKTTASHALSYSITKFYGIPHGQAVSITIANLLKYNFTALESKCSFLPISVINLRKNKVLDALNCNTIDSVFKRINYIIKSINIEVDRSKIDVDLITKGVNQQRLKNNPVEISDLRELFI